MNEYIKIGKIVNTHGIKGELRILSDFIYKERIFKKGFIIYIGPYLEAHKIVGYRFHKVFDMIMLEGFNNINEVLKYKGCFVYIKRSDLKLNDGEYLLDDLLEMNVYFEDKFVGKVLDYQNNNGNILLKISNGFIPYNNYFIKNIDLENKRIDVVNVEGLIC